MNKKASLLLLNILCFINLVQAQNVSTLAGSSAGFANNTGIAAQFNQPDGICVDTNGYIYATDRANHKIRKITPEGVVTTFAGSTFGFNDAIGTQAQFKDPRGICIDALGNLYVADGENNKVRKITPDGTVSTFAEIIAPIGLCIDTNGNLYVSDSSLSRIRKITPDGTVSIFAGNFTGNANGTGTAALFYNPFGMCADSSGNLYIADTNNHNIRKITANAEVTILAGSTTGLSGQTNGVGTAAKFNYPYGIIIDPNGILYVTDNGYNKIRKIMPDASVTNFAGSDFGFFGTADGSGNTAEFYNPSGICITPNGTMYISDKGNHRIRKINGTLETIENEASNLSLKLYPNPASNHLNIDTNSTQVDDVLVITDVLGKTLYSQKVFNSKITIDINNYSQGIYYVTLIKGDNQETKKLIIK